MTAGVYERQWDGKQKEPKMLYKDKQRRRQPWRQFDRTAF